MVKMSHEDRSKLAEALALIHYAKRRLEEITSELEQEYRIDGTRTLLRHAGDEIRSLLSANRPDLVEE